MSNNQIFEAVSIAVLVFYAFVLLWTLRHSPALLLVVNAVTAVAITTYDLIPLRYVLEDERLMAIVAFEILAFAVALLALRRKSRLVLVFSYAVFGVHLCVSSVAVYLAFFLRINRLI